MQSENKGTSRGEGVHLDSGHQLSLCWFQRRLLTQSTAMPTARLTPKGCAWGGSMLHAPCTCFLHLQNKDSGLLPSTGGGQDEVKVSLALESPSPEKACHQSQRHRSSQKLLTTRGFRGLSTQERGNRKSRPCLQGCHHRQEGLRHPPPAAAMS